MITVTGQQGRDGGSANVYIDISGIGAAWGRRHIASFYAPRQAQAEAVARAWVAAMDALDAMARVHGISAPGASPSVLHGG